jgi:CO/xanthine dehydrogenase FAD-binding subunit
MDRWDIETVYARPRNINDAVALLSAGNALVVCGGTDVYPTNLARPLIRPVVDISAVPEWRGIIETIDYFRIGGTTTWSDIIRTPLPPAFDGLKAAAREVGSIQIQNRATIAGNLCNASPAADGVPPLLTLDAYVELSSQRGRRKMPLAAFITGYRKTALAPDEVLSAVIVPKPSARAASSFVKLGARRYLVISIIMAAAVIERDAAGTILKAAVAIGSASPVALRLTSLEAALLGLPRHVRPSSIVTPAHMAALSPIDDVRASGAYRREAAIAVVGEALDRASG